MKILAENRDGFIVQVSVGEAANLVGYYSTYSDGARATLRVGDEVQVSKMYQQLREFAGMRSQLEAARRTLESIANQLQLVPPLIPVADITEPGEKKP